MHIPDEILAWAIDETRTWIEQQRELHRPAGGERSMRRIWRGGKSLLRSGQTCMHEASYRRKSLNRGNWP
jgi:hypothetical protein